jgi:hypothetical protein
LVLRWLPSILQVVRIIRPETLVRWQRAGFRCYWRWKSLGRGGRPQIETEVRALIRRMGIENPLWGAPRSPWQNGYCERAIGSIRREWLDHVVVFGERHLHHLLRSFATYYNSARTHLSVNKDAPSPRTVHAVGRILPTPFLGGLHHLYVRI